MQFRTGSDDHLVTGTYQRTFPPESHWAGLYEVKADGTGTAYTVPPRKIVRKLKT